MHTEKHQAMTGRLKRARCAAKLTQGDVAEEMGVTRQTVSSWERGTTSPSIENLAALCVIYGVSADLILYGENTVRFDASDLRALSRRHAERLAAG